MIGPASPEKLRCIAVVATFVVCAANLVSAQSPGPTPTEPATASRAPASLADSLKAQDDVFAAVRNRMVEAAQEVYLDSTNRYRGSGGGKWPGARIPAATIQTRRKAAVDAVARAWATVPGDEWITGTLIDQYFQTGQIAQARAVARDCRGTPWWCELLQVYVAHRTDPFARGDAALNHALLQMPTAVRCAWVDVSLLFLDDAPRERYEGMSCAERAAFEERLWWLADPMFSTPGNERRVEHYVREIALRLRYQASFLRCGFATGISLIRQSVNYFDLASPRSPPMSVSSDAPTLENVGADPTPTFGEVAVEVWKLIGNDCTLTLSPFSMAAGPRLGTSAALAPPLRSDSGSVERNMIGLVLPEFGAPPVQPGTAVRLGFGTGSLGPARDARTADQFIAGDRNTASFVPAIRAIDDPFHASPADWVLNHELPTLLGAEYPESGVSRVGPISQLDWQLGYFLRGDSARLVVATDVGIDSVLERGVTQGGVLRGALAVSSSPRTAPRIFRLSNGPRFVFSPIVPAESSVVSLEVLSLGRSAGRIRAGGAPPAPTGQRLRVSDVMLYKAGAADRPRPLDLMLPFLYPSAQLSRGSRVGLFWEEYGLMAGETPSLAISAVQEDAPGLLLRVLGGGASQLPITVVTEERASGNAIEPRILTIDLTTLDPGIYSLVVAVSLPGQAPVEVRRRIEIMP